MGSKGGGGAAPAYSSQTTTLPAWIQQPAQQAVQQAQTLNQRPFEANPYEQVAPQTPDQLQAYQQIRDMQGGTTGAFGTAMQGYQGLAGQAAPITPGQVNAQTGDLYGNYQNTVGSAGQNMLGGYLQGGPLTAGQVSTNASQLMNPYIQQAIDPAIAQMRQGLAQNLQQIGKGAADVGAFGGTRQGVAEGVTRAQEAQAEGKLTGDMLTQGYQNALQTGLGIGQLGSQQGYNAATGLTNLAQQGYQNAQQQGFDLSKLNLASGLSALQQIPGLATNQATEQMREAGLLQTIGQAQQQQGQAGLDTQAGVFAEGQNWPVQNLDILLSTLTGAPYGTTTAGFAPQQQARSNVGGEVLGGLSSAAGIGASIAVII